MKMNIAIACLCILIFIPTVALGHYDLKVSDSDGEIKGVLMSEDINPPNGRLDPGEDINGNDQLDTSLLKIENMDRPRGGYFIEKAVLTPIQNGNNIQLLLSPLIIKAKKDNVNIEFFFQGEFHNGLPNGVAVLDLNGNLVVVDKSEGSYVNLLGYVGEYTDFTGRQTSPKGPATFEFNAQKNFNYYNQNLPIILRGKLVINLNKNEDTLNLPRSASVSAIPEFPTIALPVVTVLGIMFLIFRTKRDNKL